MQSFMTSSTWDAVICASSGGMIPASASRSISPVIDAMIISPTSGVCHCCAMSCQTYSRSIGPSPHAHVRIRSGRTETRRWTSRLPQSCPTRSTGSPTRATSPASHSTYASFVASNPAGTGAPNPGSDGVRMSRRLRWARSLSHRRCVSGTPCTRTAGMVRRYTARVADALGLQPVVVVVVGFDVVVVVGSLVVVGGSDVVVVVGSAMVVGGSDVVVVVGSVVVGGGSVVVVVVEVGVVVEEVVVVVVEGLVVGVVDVVVVVDPSVVVV